MTASIHSESVRERFWRYVHRRQDHECWPWTGAASRKGYGAMGVGRRVHRAHRVSWELHLGAIPVGAVVRHTCHNPTCCNPSHLLLGTPADNSRDMVEAGRQGRRNPRRGEQHPDAVLTEEAVAEIRSSQDTLEVLAARYGITAASISAVRRGRTWAHVPRGSPPVPYRGEAVWKAKLSEDDVRAILSSPDSAGVLSERYGVTVATISHIRRGKTWKHLSRNK